MAKPLMACLEILRGGKPLAAESVHRVRRDLKRARAGLRLLRDAVGKLAYARENACLRDAARPLAPLRNADATAVLLARLIEAKKTRAHRARLVRLRTGVRREAAALRAGLKKSLVHDIQVSIEATDARVSQWRMPRDGWPVLRSGLERIYRKGRGALAAARSRGTDRSLHEVRKQVKYLGAALEFLQPELKAKLVKRADAVAEALGDDHDLIILRRRLGYADRELAAWIGRRRARLQKRALKDARRLYRSKPRTFVESLE